MLDSKNISELEKKIIVENNPFPHSIIENFLPTDIITRAEDEFINFKKVYNSGNKLFQKTKKSSENYDEMPGTIKKIISFFNSKDFIDILEKKFDLRNIEPDWSLHGGGLHESFRGGYLKIHSDFIYKRKSKLRRVLNLLLYINSNWEKNWGGSLELWDREMKSPIKSILPELNKAVIFRTDTESNHGFPDPINCPENLSRKSIALYYYVKEKGIFPITIKKRKYFHAVWKRRPNIDEPKFADNDGFFKRIKHKFFYRFF
tara:strand:+ start:55 stop:834 length:780 start_codon:yes stop_codon:yes gene_type:complete